MFVTYTLLPACHGAGRLHFCRFYLRVPAVLRYLPLPASFYRTGYQITIYLPPFRPHLFHRGFDGAPADYLPPRFLLPAVLPQVPISWNYTVSRCTTTAVSGWVPFHRSSVPKHVSLPILPPGSNTGCFLPGPGGGLRNTCDGSTEHWVGTAVALPARVPPCLLDFLPHLPACTCVLYTCQFIPFLWSARFSSATCHLPGVLTYISIFCLGGHFCLPLGWYTTCLFLRAYWKVGDLLMGDTVSFSSCHPAVAVTWNLGYTCSYCLPACLDYNRRYR